MFEDNVFLNGNTIFINKGGAVDGERTKRTTVTLETRVCVQSPCLWLAY